MATTRQNLRWGPAAICLSAVLHLLLVWYMLRLVIEVVPPPRIISIVLVRPPPPNPAAQPAPKPAPKPVPKPVPKPAVKPTPVPILIPHAAPGPKHRSLPHVHATPAPPALHFGAAGAAPGLGLGLGISGGGNGQGGIGAFDDAVKQRIEAAKTYPPGIPYLWNQCIVEYQVTVNQAGQLLTYKLYGCDDPFLDSAARAAILMAAPFPVPPNFGGSHYTVFGSLVFKHH